MVRLRTLVPDFERGEDGGLEGSLRSGEQEETPHNGSRCDLKGRQKYRTLYHYGKLCFPMGYMMLQMRGRDETAFNPTVKKD